MFLRLFLNPVILVQSLPIVFKGFLMSLSIVLVAFPLAIPFGFALSLMRISKSRILRCLAGIYVNIIRGTPAFLQISLSRSFRFQTYFRPCIEASCGGYAE